MATLTVGAGKQYPTLQKALPAVKSGDVLAIDAGEYVLKDDDTNPKWLRGLTNVTVKGVGGMAKIRAGSWVWNEMGIFVVNGDVTFDHIEFADATGSSGNIGGIRWEGGNLVVTNCEFHGCQNGILGSLDSPSTPTAKGTVTITDSDFHDNGNPNGGAGTHNIYINNCARLLVQRCYFHDVWNEYNLFKSRAEKTDIEDCRFFGNASNESYEVDIPSGGVATLRRNIIHQGAKSKNRAIVTFGCEDSRHDVHKLTMEDNVVINELANAQLVLRGGDKFAVEVKGTKIFSSAGAVQMPSGNGVSVSSTTMLSTKPTMDTSSPIGGGSGPVDPGPVDPGPVDPGPVDPPPASGTAPKIGISIEVQASRILRIDVTQFGVKASEYSTRITRKTVGKDCEVTVDGKQTVLIQGWTAGDLNAAKFKFAT